MPAARSAPAQTQWLKGSAPPTGRAAHRLAVCGEEPRHSPNRRTVRRRSANRVTRIVGAPAGNSATHGGPLRFGYPAAEPSRSRLRRRCRPDRRGHRPAAQLAPHSLGRTSNRFPWSVPCGPYRFAPLVGAQLGHVALVRRHAEKAGTRRSARRRRCPAGQQGIRWPARSTHPRSVHFACSTRPPHLPMPTTCW